MTSRRAWTAAVWALAAVWLAMLAGGLRLAALDTGLAGIYARGGDPYPTMLAARPYVPLGDSALRPGDTLIEIEGRSLEGAGAVRFFQLAAAPMRPEGIPVVYERGGVRAETQLPQLSTRLFRTSLLFSLSAGLAGLLLALRAKRTPAILWGVPGAFVLAIEMGGHPSAIYPGAQILTPLWFLAVAFEAPLLFHALTYFPEEDGRDLRWVRRLSWLIAIRAPLAASAAYGALVPPVTVGIPLLMILASLPVGGAVAILTRNYLRADAISRRQLRWTVFGIQLAALPWLVLIPLVAKDARYIPWLFDSIAAFTIVPVCIVISVLRYNWFDIDRLVSATAAYNVLGIVFVGIGLVVAPQAGAAASGLLGVPQQAGQTLAAFLLAAAAFPTYRRLQPRLEGVFFPERRAIDAGAARLLSALGDVSHPGELPRVLGGGLAALFHAESLAIYAPNEEGFGVVFAHGPAVPSAVDEASGLFPNLARRGRPLALDDRESPPLSPLDRALLETVGARVLLPVLDAGALALLVCLGAKGSGDIYTATDLRLLDAIAQRASAELQRFDQERRVRESRALQESLRRFVPGAVADQLESGRELGSRECEVSVLFVDMRGYTAWAEGRGAADVFSTINRYTEAVSQVVTRCGGSVVEFNGDGMMAVFGAPDPIPEKERAAVTAARELCSAVSALGADGEFTVGVGVATGQAFVGAIRAVDRLIWSAIGNTTNLAARLQSLTRDLEAAVVIDEATSRGAGSAASGFRRIEDVEVRGRRERMTLHALAATRT